MNDEETDQEETDINDQTFIEMEGGGKIDEEGVKTLIDEVRKENNNVEKINGYHVYPSLGWEEALLSLGVTTILSFPAYAWGVGIGILHTFITFVVLISLFGHIEESKERLKIIRSMQLNEEEEDEW